MQIYVRWLCSAARLRWLLHFGICTRSLYIRRKIHQHDNISSLNRHRKPLCKFSSTMDAASLPALHPQPSATPAINKATASQANRAYIHNYLHEISSIHARCSARYIMLVMFYVLRSGDGGVHALPTYTHTLKF